YVTVMNGSVEGDAGLVEISKDGTVNVFAKGINEPKGVADVGGDLYFSDVTRVWKVDKDGNTSILADKADFPHEVLYLNDVSQDGEGKGIYVADMGDTKFMRDGNGNLWPLDSEEAKLVPKVGRVYPIDLDGNVTIAQNASE